MRRRWVPLVMTVALFAVACSSTKPPLAESADEQAAVVRSSPVATSGTAEAATSAGGPTRPAGAGAAAGSAGSSDPAPNGRTASKGRSVVKGAARPSGSIAYVADRGVCVVATDGSDPECSLHPEHVYGARWSPDGQHITGSAVGEAPTSAQIYGLAADEIGAPLRSITPITLTAFSPDWSKQDVIVFHAAVTQGCVKTCVEDWDIYTIRADGSDQRRLTSGRSVDVYPVWSPDGTKIAYGCDGQICVMNADGSGKKTFWIEGVSAAGFPEWSPDAKTIAFLATYASRSPLSSGDTSGTIWLIGADGKKPRELSPSAGARTLVWSPKGNRFAYSTDYSSIATIARDGSDHREHFELSWAKPDWSPDGRWLAFAANTGGSTVDIMRAADGTERESLAFDGGIGSVDWSP